MARMKWDTRKREARARKPDIGGWWLRAKLEHEAFLRNEAEKRRKAKAAAAAKNKKQQEKRQKKLAKLQAPISQQIPF